MRAGILLQVWDSGLTAVVRTVVDAEQPAGTHMVAWDGRDTAGDKVPEGTYPYRLTATEAGGTVVLFEDTKLAHVDCSTPVTPTTWGALKVLYTE